jgi:hypothetical protein
MLASKIAFVIFAVLAASASAFAANPVEQTVHSFLGKSEGAFPEAGLVADASGNLYGTTSGGGEGFCCWGTVFELSPPTTAGGAWTETVLYAFGFGPDELYTPMGTLIFDTQGNLYGTASAGGAGAGGVFELSPPSTPGGAWTETTLWEFEGYEDGAQPFGKLVMDTAGNLYGTAATGGSRRDGTVFELVAPTTPGGAWSEQTLYEFGSVANDGLFPGSDLLLRHGVLYGTTQAGGSPPPPQSSSYGTVFQLAPKAGHWTETILHRFAGTDGLDPLGGLIADSAGNLYGTTYFGGNTTACPGGIVIGHGTETSGAGCGTIYELSPPAAAGDPWQETTLYAFTNPGDGMNPSAALWRNKSGSLYGTAYDGGRTTGNDGVVFVLNPPGTAGEDWVFTVLHYFRGPAVDDGAKPLGALTHVGDALFGTTSFGGEPMEPKAWGGTVFSIVP